MNLPQFCQLCQDDFPILSNLITLYCPFYAAQVCLSSDYGAIRILHEQFFKAMKKFPPLRA